LYHPTISVKALEEILSSDPQPVPWHHHDAIYPKTFSLITDGGRKQRTVWLTQIYREKAINRVVWVDQLPGNLEMFGN